MRRGKVMFAALIALAALGAAPASAKSPAAVARAYANSHMSQSPSKLSKTLANPTVQAYQSPTTGVSMQSHATPPHASAQGVLGATATHATGTLPFTGADLGVFAGIALGLIGLGLLLRKFGRDGA
jgi:hypothetical protein